MIYKFLKFAVVGFSGLIIDYLVTYICKEKIKLQQYLANSIGFIVAAINNYYLNRVWTFHSLNDQVIIEFSSFLFISGTGLLINNLFLHIFNGENGWGRLLANKIKPNSNKDLGFYISKLFAIVVTTFWNFFANYYFTFNL